MTELNQLIAEFKITLDKFETIASRMEARNIKLMNIHRYKYEHPKGYPVRVRSDEVYGWAAVKPETGEVNLESFQQFDDELCKLADGWEWKKFTLTLSDSAGPVDPLADCPPFPPLPEGFARWAYRGKGWKSKERVRFASYGRFDTDWVTFPFGCTVGYETTYYIEAVKDEQSVPEVAVPFPPIPEGYSRWAYRGKGWTSMDPVKYAYWMHPFKTWVILNDSIPVGIKDNHYIEAVKDPA